jgi:hypothetical protein
MVEQQDSFWKLFFVATLGIVCLAGLVIAAMIIRPADSLPTLPHTSSAEPYAYVQADSVTATSTYFYRESIPLGFSNASWSASIDWRSPLRRFEGSYAARAEFTSEWGGLAVAGSGHPRTSYSGISLAVFAEPGLSDLYLELYNAAGNPIGRQSIGWYFPEGALVTGRWQQLTIPIQNFGSAPNVIGGFAVLAPQKGVAYVDDVRLTRTAPAHAAWTPEKNGDTAVSLGELFARTKEASLPYSLRFEPLTMLDWHASSGLFLIEDGRLRVGPAPKGGGMHATFLGGRTWTDYRIDATVLWGPAASVSLAARITDENSQVSCSYSQLGTVVQIYSMQQGTSTLVAESAYTEMDLPSRLEWAKVPLSMEVRGKRVYCYAYGRLLLTAYPPNMPENGSVGIEVWDEKTGVEPHIVTVFSVSPPR